MSDWSFLCSSWNLKIYFLSIECLSPKASPDSQPMNLTSDEYWQPTDLTFSFSSRVTHNFFFILDISLGNEHQNFFLIRRSFPNESTFKTYFFRCANFLDHFDRVLLTTLGVYTSYNFEVFFKIWNSKCLALKLFIFS